MEERHGAPAIDGATALDRRGDVVSAVGSAGGWDWDLPGNLLRFDPPMAALYGVDPAEAEAGLPPECFYAAIHPEDARRVRIAVAGVVRGVEIFLRSFRVIAPDGTTRWMEAHGRTELGDDDEPARFKGFILDVTDRRAVEERLRIAQSAGQVGTFEHVPGFATASVSEQFCALLGLQPAEVLPIRTINWLVAPGQPALFGNEPRSDGETFYSEVLVERADTGEHRWIARRGETVASGGPAGVRHVGVIYDITETREARAKLEQLNHTLERRVQEEVVGRMQVEEALRQAQKMEAVGQLTGGIAHDFNNLLTVIMGNLDMAVRRLGPSDARVERSLANAVKGAQRASALTQRLLAFSRRQPLDPRQIDISRLLSGMADLLGRTIGEAVRLETQFAPDLWPVEVDPNQLENALVNLAVNARDAMDGKGELTIAAENVSVAGERRATDPKPGDYVLLSVTDTGTGMAEETVLRACDPFYTTKEVGKGTGLGLSMVYGFVTQSAGHFAIRSAIGVGTTIQLFFPRLRGAAPVEHEAEQPAGEQVGTSEAILVVEDDEDVRAYAVEGLTELGYHVLEAADGASALGILERVGKGVDLLLTDVIMPRMSGRELVDAARAMHTGLRVLYTSGYPRDVIVRDGRLETGVELLPKPFTYAALAAKVRDILDRA